MSFPYLSLNQLKIYLTAKRVDERDFDPHVVAVAEFAAVARAFDDVFFFVVMG